MVNLPIFIMLLGILVSVANLTASTWNYEPTEQTIETLDANTAVTFANPSGEKLAKKGDYEVAKRYVTIKAKRPSTGEIQNIKVLIRKPKGAGNGRPGVVFMHGAGYGTCDNSFGDMASDLSSAGFVTAVLDKPVWSTNDANRDYPGSAAIYDQVMQPSSENGYGGRLQSGHLRHFRKHMDLIVSAAACDPDVAFQVLLSPMVYEPRYSLGFLAAQDFALVGAHDGYQSIVRRVFNIDASLFGLTNLDIDTLTPKAYAIPTLVAYGTKDVMTAQVEGTEKIVDLAHQAGNWDVTIRTYPIANHVLRLGDEANPEPRSPTRTWTMWSTGPSAPRTDSNRPANAWPAPEPVPVNRSAIGPQSQSRPDHLPGRVACQHAWCCCLPQACCGSPC